MTKVINVGINGFGRIGRIAARICWERKDVRVKAINSRADAYSHAHLLKYDTNYAIFKGNVEASDSFLLVDGEKISVYREEDPARVPWKNDEVDIVIEATGIFKTLKDNKKHLKGGAKEVIISAPADEDIKTFCVGVNHQKFSKKQDKIISNASCTTNCLAVVAKVLDEKFKIVNGFMTTIHSYTDSQNLLDNSHRKNKRLARSAACNIIPSSTGASEALAQVLPQLSGKIHSVSLRVPTPTVSLVDLVVSVERKATKDKVISVFKDFAESTLKGLLGVTSDPIVSSDVKGSSFSALVDLPLTNVSKNLVNVKAWYDNEWGYTSRLIDLVEYVGERI